MSTGERLAGFFVGVLLAIVAVFILALIVVGLALIYEAASVTAVLLTVVLGIGGYLGAKHIFS